MPVRHFSRTFDARPLAVARLYATVHILVACAHGAEVPTPLQPRIAHAGPYRPSAIECFDAQAQPRHPLIDHFILDAAPLIGEGGLTVSAVIRTGILRFWGKPSASMLGHFWGTKAAKEAFQP